MTGRHRKPSTTGRTVAKVAVTGAIVGTASMAFSAGTANAAPDNDWDRLAQCESGGNWAIDTGNGFDGGLQFSPSTWTSHGGGAFAASANQATREEQIVVAERVLASQGWGAWPSCSSRLGLSSGPTERSAPAASTPAPALPALPAAPDVAAISQNISDQISTAVRSFTNDPTVVAFVENATANLRQNPQLVSFFAANQNLLPR